MVEINSDGKKIVARARKEDVEDWTWGVVGELKVINWQGSEEATLAKAREEARSWSAAFFDYLTEQQKEKGKLPPVYLSIEPECLVGGKLQNVAIGLRRSEQAEWEGLTTKGQLRDIVEGVKTHHIVVRRAP